MKDAQAIRQAIDTAEEELVSIKARLEEMKPLMQRQEKLEAFLLHARALLPVESSPGERHAAGTEVKTEAEARRVDGKAVWNWAEQVLTQARHPMRVIDITNEIIRSGRQLSDKWGTEVVRAAMGRMPDVFERVAPGLYALKSWPQQMKAVRRV